MTPSGLYVFVLYFHQYFWILLKEFLSPSWETWFEFSAPDFGLAKSQMLGASEVWARECELSLTRSLSDSFFFKKEAHRETVHCVMLMTASSILCLCPFLMLFPERYLSWRDTWLDLFSKEILEKCLPLCLSEDDSSQDKNKTQALRTTLPHLITLYLHFLPN